MKQFFKFMFASMLGIFLTIIISLLIFIGIISSFSKKEVVKVEPNTILHIKLDKKIYDRASKNPVDLFDIMKMNVNKNPGLNDILNNIEKAKNDNKIKGIFLDLSNIATGFATIEEIRNQLIDFKKSGKFIISYSDYYSQKSYYLATVADKIYLNPEGNIDFKGLNAEILFLKGLLNKIDVDVQIVRHGKYKSAVEPFMLDKMSKANKEQTITFVSTLWNQMLKGISKSRNISIKELNNIADNLLIQNANDAIKYKFIDNKLYKDELFSELRTKIGISNKAKLNFISLAKYTSAPNPIKKEFTRDRIAVIYALGDIKSGKGNDQVIGSETISKAIRKARLNKNVKAIVLRVNSPGGSALASEIIWRELSLARKVKPLVASFGDYAASGGYYISCVTDTIIASPNTITGSIGVFGIIPNFKNFFNNKLGVTFDNVKTNKNSGFISVNRPMTAYERSVVQKNIENTYSTFVNHVSEGRNMSFKEVDNIGQGRVWAGADAKKIGLIDDFGGLNKAIDIAAEMANIKNYRLLSLPVQKDPLTLILEEMSGNSQNSMLKTKLGDNYKYLMYFENLMNLKGVQARLPFIINFN
ncbi:MAG: signal peptide peptidase SppA [Bacteroidales bacterium]|nr:signal peptide peptidase SppA [Bacteroidales bacterium]